MVPDNYYQRWSVLDPSSRFAYWAHDWGGNDVRISSFRWTAEGGVQILAAEDSDAEQDVDVFFRFVSADGTTAFGTRYSDSDGTQGFRWSGATGMALLDFEPTAVSPEGRAAVGFRDHLPVLWREGVGTIEIDPTWSAMSSNLGGLGFFGDGAVILASSVSGQVFRWTSATGSTLVGELSIAGASRSADVLIGSTGSFGQFRAVRWSERSGLRDLGDVPAAPTGAWQQARLSSDDGSVVVGDVQLDDTVSHVFRWTESTGMQDITPGPRKAASTYVSPDGQVVIGLYWSDLGSAAGAFRWTAATGAVDVNYTTLLGIGADGDLLVGNTLQGWSVETFGELAGTLPELVRLQPELVPSDWSDARLDGVSRDGRLLVGNGLNPAGQREPWLLHLSQSCSGK